MLTDQDVLLLKLALERELLDGTGYRRVLASVRSKGSAGGVGRALRLSGVAGERVGELAEIVAAAGKDPSGAILSRSDLEDVIVAKAIARSKLLTDDKVERARGEQRGMARMGELSSLTEILVKRRWLEVPVAVELRRRARERVATCQRCWRHFVVDPAKSQDGLACRECSGALQSAVFAQTAVEVARGLPPERPPPPIEASLLGSAQASDEGSSRPRLALPARASSRPDFLGGTATKPEKKPTPSPSPPPPSPAPTPPSPVALPRKEKEREAARAAEPAPRPKTPQPSAPAPVTPAPERDAFTPPDSAAARRLEDKKTTEETPVAVVSSQDGDPSSIVARTARWDSLEDLEDAAPVVPAVATFGEYEILTEVARGGMGIVYKARRKGSQKPLALKVLISGVDATEEQVRRFEREGEAARRMRHRGIVRVYDAGRHEGYHYIAMEYVEGRTLEDVLSQGPLPHRRAATIMASVAEAVHHMHEAGIVHRDLKPGNVMLNAEDEPKLIDFGLAKSIDRRAKLTRSGAAVGTPYYMPPEQVRGETGKIGPLSDVYALGAIFYEMIAGEVPFQAENPIELYHKIASSELTLPDKVREGIPRDLVTITAKCLEKAQEDRYATAALLAEDLRHWLDGEPVRGERKEKAPPRGERRGRHRGLLAALLAAAVLVTGLALSVKLLLPRLRAREYRQDGEAALAARRFDDARVFLERALEILPRDAALEIALARALAPKDAARALALLEQAERDGPFDSALLDSPDLAPLAQEARFKELLARARAGRQ